MGGMIEFRQGGRRRLDRVLDPAFLAELATCPMDEVRAKRDDAAQEETDLSYLRRLLHARMDIVRFEQRRRAAAAAGTEGPSLVNELPRILADNALGPAVGRGRHHTVQPSRAESHRRHLEALLADTGLSDVATLPDADLAAPASPVSEEQVWFASSRCICQQFSEACNEEIGRRY